MNLIKTFLLFVIGLFPSLPDMSFLIQPFQTVIDIIYTVNIFVDVRALGFCFVVLIIFFNIEFLWGVIMWVIRKIPGVS